MQIKRLTKTLTLILRNKLTETYHIPKKDSGNGGEVDILYDFKQVTTLVKGQSGHLAAFAFLPVTLARKFR